MRIIDIALKDPLLTDFDLIQPGHWGWPSIGNEVLQVNRRYAHTDIIKPVVVGEVVVVRYEGPRGGPGVK